MKKENGLKKENVEDSEEGDDLLDNDGEAVVSLLSRFAEHAKRRYADPS